MLVLTRKPGEQIMIGYDITVTVVRCSDRNVRIGIDAPQSMAVDRREVRERPDYHPDHGDEPD